MSTLLHELRTGLRNPATYEADLLARCESAEINITDLQARITASDETLKPEEKCIVLHGVLMRKQHSAKAQAVLGPIRRFKPVTKDVLSRTKERGLQLVKENTAEKPTEEKAAFSAYHTVNHASEVAFIVKLLMQAYGAAATGQDFVEFAAIFHDVIQNAAGSGANEVESAIIAFEELEKRLSREQRDKWDIYKMAPYLLLEAIVHATTLSKGSFKPLWFTLDDVTDTCEPAVMDVVTSMAYADLHAACNLEYQRLWSTRIQTNFEQIYGTTTKLHECGLFADPTFVLLFGQNSRMLPELNPYYTEDHRLDRISLEYVRQRRRSSLGEAGATEAAAAISAIAAERDGETYIPSPIERIFTCYVQRLPKEQGFARGQHANLQETPRRLRAKGFEERATAFEEVTDMDTWGRHAEKNLPMLRRIFNGLNASYLKLRASLAKATKEGKAEKANALSKQLRVFVQTEIQPLVDQCLWVSAHQPGAYINGNVKANPFVRMHEAGSSRRLTSGPRDTLEAARRRDSRFSLITGRRHSAATTRVPHNTPRISPRPSLAATTGGDITPPQTTDTSSTGGSLAFALRECRRRNTEGGSTAVSVAAAPGGVATPPHSPRTPSTGSTPPRREDRTTPPLSPMPVTDLGVTRAAAVADALRALQKEQGQPSGFLPKI